MIISMGVDVIEVLRIAEAMQNPRFLKRILTLKERETIKHPARVAGRWAAKEAIAKCMSFLDLKLSWQDIEILNDSSGKPHVIFHPFNLAQKGYKLHLSISHERSLSVATAILERIFDKKC